MSIIALSGKIGSGKNYLAEKVIFDILRKKGKNVLILAFGDYLKISCNIKDKIPYEKLFGNKDIETRKILQNRGMKDREFDDEIFIKTFECFMKMSFDRGVDFIIVSDLRFPIEFLFLKSLKNHTIIRINSPNRTKDKMLLECNGDEKIMNDIKNHISENALDYCVEFDHYINNDYQNENMMYTYLSNIINKLDV